MKQRKIRKLRQPDPMVVRTKITMWIGNHKQTELLKMRLDGVRKFIFYYQTPTRIY